MWIGGSCGANCENCSNDQQSKFLHTLKITHFLINLKYRGIPIGSSGTQAYIYDGIKENSWASAYCECSN